MTQPHLLDLAPVFQRVQSVVLAANDLETFLQQVSELAAGAASQPISCGITAREDGRLLTVASSDEQAGALDESQYSAGQGPCLHSLNTGDVVLIDDVDQEDRWPNYVEKPKSVGLRCSLSLPLKVNDTTVGAMNLYGFGEPAQFTEAVRHRCELFAAYASGALQITLGRAADQQLLEHLEQALASRTVIDQAIGILMGQQHCTADQAFALLRSRSQSSQLKLRDVAAELITRVSGQPPQPGRPFERVSPRSAGSSASPSSSGNPDVDGHGGALTS